MSNIFCLKNKHNSMFSLPHNRNILKRHHTEKKALNPTKYSLTIPSIIPMPSIINFSYADTSNKRQKTESLYSA